MRSPFQVLVIPYRRSSNSIEYAAFHRADMRGAWQAVSGGGEDEESPMEAAVRETGEEAGLPQRSAFVELESTATIPVEWVGGFRWGPETLVIPEHSFGVEATSQEIRLSSEHSEFKWGSYEATLDTLNMGQQPCCAVGA